jgi:hypothetical protein
VPSRVKAAVGEDAVDADGRRRLSWRTSALKEAPEGAGQAPWHGTVASLRGGTVAGQAAAHGEEAAGQGSRWMGDHDLDHARQFFFLVFFFSFLLIVGGGGWREQMYLNH